MSNMETNEFYSRLLNDAWTVYMTFCGILISIITLLYSVILGKRSELEVYAEQAKLGHSDPLMRRRHQITVKVIKKMASVNRWVFAILCVSLLNCTLSWLSFRFLPQEYKRSALYLIGILSIFVLIITICQVRKLYIQYKQDTMI